MSDTVKPKKRWFLKAELLVLLCLVVLWIVDLKTDCVPRAAAGALRQAVKVAPNWENGHDALGWVYLSCRNHEKAYDAYCQADIIAYKRAIRIDPNDAQAHFDLAQSYHYNEEDNIEQAIERYRAAIRIEPNWAGAWLFLGLAYEDVGHYHKAINAYEEALIIDPEDLYTQACLANGYLELGISYEKVGRDEEAQAYIQKAMLTNPNLPTELFRYGKWDYREGNWMDAIENYKLSIKLKPNNPEAHYNLGKAYLKIENKDLAWEEYEILKTLDEELANELLGIIN